MINRLTKYFTLLLILTIMLLPLPLQAAESGGVITLSQAKALAVRDSPDIEKQKVTNELTRINERDAWIAYEQAKAAYQNSGGKVDSLKIAMDNAKKAYDAAVYANSDGKVSQENLNKKIEYDVESQYLNLLNMDNNIKIAEKNYQLQTTNVNIESLKMHLGLSTKFLLDQQIQKAMQVEKQLQATYDTHKTLKWNFNRTLGRDLAAPFELAPVSFNPVKHENQQAGELKAIDSSLAVDQFNRTVEDKQKEIQDKLYTASDKVEKLDFEIKQTSLLKSETEYQLKLKMKNLHEKLYLAQKTLVDNRSIIDMAKLNYEISQQQYELGMISKLALSVSEVSYLQTQANYEKAVYDYYLAAREVSLAEDGIYITPTSM